MKFLLTSAGIKNKSLVNALTDLVGKPAKEISVLFILTAANTVEGDKDWLIDNLNDLKREYKSVDILDIAGVPQKIWQPRMEAVDIICFGGGDEQYLAKVLRDSGVDQALPELLKTRVYMGISAGSMVAGQFLSHDLIKIVYPEEIFEGLNKPLGFVDCLFIPHLNSEYFTQVRKEILEKHKADFNFPFYACDDNSGLKIVDGKIEVISEGEYFVLGK